jgi:hypothetical protein
MPRRQIGFERAQRCPTIEQRPEGVLPSVESDAKHALYAVLRPREEVARSKENLSHVDDFDFGELALFYAA